MNLKNLMTCIVLVAFGCAENRKQADKSPDQATQQVTVPVELGLADYGVQSFQDLPIEKRCDGIGEFFQFIVKKYLDPRVVFVEQDREVHKDSFDCHSTRMYLFPVDTYSRYFNLFSGGQQITFSIDIRTASFAYASEIDSVKVYSSVYNSDYRGYEKDFGTNIATLELIARKWINGFSTSNWTYLGKSQQEFVTDLTTKHGVNGESFVASVKRFDSMKPEAALVRGFDMSKRIISFQFEPSIIGEYTGIVKIGAASSEIFQVVDSSGAIENAPYLGCMTLQCLQKITVVYEFYGTSLYLTATDSFEKQRHTEFIYSFESHTPPINVMF